MPENKLYHVLNSEFCEQASIPKVKNLKDKDGKSYFMLELSLLGELQIGNYQLSDHHLSIYEQNLDGFLADSQYHYTAHFKDKSGAKYRLHVYFDAHDKIIEDLFFAHIKADHTPEKVNCEDHKVVFEALMSRSITDLVSSLRALQNKILKGLRAELADLNILTSEALENVQSDKQAYFLALATQIEKLSELCLYANDTRVFLSKMHFLQNTYKNAQAREASVALCGDESPTDESSSPIALSATPPPRRKSFTKKTHLNKTINAFSHRFNTQDSVKQLEQLFQDVEYIKSDLDFGIYTASTEDIKNLQDLYDKIQASGIHFLQKYLVLGQYDNACELSIFFPYLPDNTVHLALAKNNAGLLNFLLSHQIISIEYKKFRIQEQNYTSLVEFCFKNPGKAALLDVLIKQGSLLMELDEHGLPFATTLLLQPQHPLRAACEKNLDKTMNNPLFYKQLNQTLSQVISKPDCNKMLKKSLGDLIERNKKIIKIVEMRLSFQGEKNGHGKLVNELVYQVQLDPEILENERKTVSKIKFLRSKLSKQEGLSFAMKTRINSQEFLASCANIPGGSFAQAFAETRKDIIAYQHSILMMLDLKGDLLDVQNQIKKLERGRPSNQLKELYIKEDELLETMNERMKDASMEQEMPRVAASSRVGFFAPATTSCGHIITHKTPPHEVRDLQV